MKLTCRGVQIITMIVANPVRAVLSDIYHGLVNLVYPAVCQGCDQPLPLVNELQLCADCEARMLPTGWGNWVDRLTHSEGLDGAYSGWFFSGPIQHFIHSLKYNDRAKLGAVLGRYLGRMLTSDLTDAFDILTAIPLFGARQRERGFNQSQWIVRGLAQALRKPADFGLLTRIRETRSQTELTSEERVVNVGDAFLASDKVRGLKIGIVDDVLTTGATASASAQALKKCGAEQVVIITCATPRIRK